MHGDGRGITAGIAGFCTGTGDAWEMIKIYHQLSGGTDDFSPMDSILEKYANSNSDSQAGLEDYCKVFADLGKNDAKFRQAQDKIRDETYLAPSQKLADQVGLKLSISQGQMYDTGLMHGPGDDPDGLASIIKETSESFTSNQTGDSGSTLTINGNQVDEIVWLKKFLEVRSDHLTNPRDPENQGGNYWAQTLYRIESYQNAIDQKEYKWTSSVKLLDNDGGPITVTCSKSLRKHDTESTLDESSSSEDVTDMQTSKLNNLETIRGVNIGGVFLIEPFIKPSLFDQFLSMSEPDRPVDEWTFTSVLGKEEARRQLEEHWDTFITKEHLETLAEDGINWIRIPIGYWAFNLTKDEPFVDGQIPYVERILEWSRDVGLKVELDLHGAPGSQNGYDNSGRRGTPEWLLSRVNVDRTLDALTKMTQLAVDWDDVVYGIQILNEPSRWKWAVSDILEFYNEAYDLVHNMAPDTYFMIHDTFLSPNDWPSLVSSNWTNALMDTHIYQMFDDYMVTLNETTHIEMVKTMAENITKFDRSQFGVVVGEFSAATHDCTKYINGFGRGSRWDGSIEGIDRPHCPFESCSCTGDYGGNYTEFSDHYKRFLKRYVDAQLQIYDQEIAGWFYWNFRTESAPEWDYLLGVEQGWIPKFPRTALAKPKEINTDGIMEATEAMDISAAAASVVALAPIGMALALAFI
ncbi:hypothetical protein IWW45_001243 [Coemansia sp. RSA 485]|nr:hypothetical protein IWW45_001243 [Coemansia sp. RSA 485]